MKIVLTANEKALLDEVAGIFGITRKDVMKAIEAKSEYGDTVITVAEEYIFDISHYITTVAPMLKGLFIYAKSTFNNCVQLAELVDKKWAAPVEQKEAA